MTAIRARWDALLRLLLGDRCNVTGERTYPRDRDAHEATEHALEGPCA